MAQTKQAPTGREIALASLKRSKNGKTAKQLGELICAKSRFNSEARYAMANARKVIYSMAQRGELERSEDGRYSLAS